MSIWDRFIKKKKADLPDEIVGTDHVQRLYDASRYAIVDIEVGLNDQKIHDIGVLRHDDAIYHQTTKDGLVDFLREVDYICGHNIVHHDAVYLFGEESSRYRLVDTLYMSPLLFPNRPYHKLLKDDKLLSEQMNNPVNDCEKARDLLFDEIAGWRALPAEKRMIFSRLLDETVEFEGFLSMVGMEELPDCNLPDLIKSIYSDKVCSPCRFSICY